MPSPKGLRGMGTELDFTLCFLDTPRPSPWVSHGQMEPILCPMSCLPPAHPHSASSRPEIWEPSLILWLCYSSKWSESHSVMSDSLRPHGLYSPWNSPGQHTGVGSFSLLQDIFPAQGSIPGLPHCRQILYQLSHQGSPTLLRISLILPPSLHPRDSFIISYLHWNFAVAL